MSAKREVVVFYDSPCIDGAAAAWSIKQAFDQNPAIEVQYVPLTYGKPGDRTRKILSHLKDGMEAIFVDTTPKDDTLDLLFNPECTPRIRKLSILDHHTSEVRRLLAFQERIRALDPNAYAGTPALEFVLNPEKPAAALLAWDYFNPGKPAPQLLHWVGKMEPPVTLKTDDDYAMAAFIDSKDIMDPKEMFAAIDSLVSMPEKDMLAQGNAIRAYQANTIKKSVKSNLTFTQLELEPGKREWIPLVNANVQNFGRGVNEALIDESHSSTTAGVSGAWSVQGDGTVKLSLRSRGQPDVAAMAQHLATTVGMSGGGHPSDAVVQFESLEQFTKAVPIYTREQMAEEIAKPRNVGQHTAAIVKKQSGGKNGGPGTPGGGPG